jgi:hypothetical protein
MLNIYMSARQWVHPGAYFLRHGKKTNKYPFLAKIH